MCVMGAFNFRALPYRCLQDERFWPKGAGGKGRQQRKRWPGEEGEGSEGGQRAEPKGVDAWT